MGFDNLAAAFGCSIVTDSMSKVFVFSTFSSYSVILFDCVVDFNKLKSVFGWLTVRAFMQLCLIFLQVLMLCDFFYLCFLKIIHGVL